MNTLADVYLLFEDPKGEEIPMRKNSGGFKGMDPGIFKRVLANRERRKKFSDQLYLDLSRSVDQRISTEFDIDDETKDGGSLMSSFMTAVVLGKHSQKDVIDNPYQVIISTEQELSQNFDNQLYHNRLNLALEISEMIHFAYETELNDKEQVLYTTFINKYHNVS